MDRKNPMRFMELYGGKFPELTSCNNATIQMQRAEELMVGTEAIRKWATDMAETRLKGSQGFAEDPNNGPRGDRNIVMVKCRRAGDISETLRALMVALDEADALGISFNVLGTSAEEAAESFQKFRMSLNQMDIAAMDIGRPPKKQEPYFRQFEKKRRNK